MGFYIPIVVAVAVIAFVGALVYSSILFVFLV